MDTKTVNGKIYWPGTNQILKPAREVAEILSVHPNTVFRWIKSGKVECTRLGKSIYFTYAQILALLENCRYQVKIQKPKGR